MAKVDLKTGKLNSEWEYIWNGTGGLVCFNTFSADRCYFTYTFLAPRLLKALISTTKMGGITC
jgi:hypothetical protein